MWFLFTHVMHQLVCKGSEPWMGYTGNAKFNVLRRTICYVVDRPRRSSGSISAKRHVCVFHTYESKEMPAYTLRRPVGLRPPAYSFPYAPIILQTLYHIHAFQHAILSYRPSPDSWGSPMNYWKGNGEQIPPYMSNRNKNISIDVDLLEESMNDIWTERHVQPDAMELEVVPTSARGMVFTRF